MSAIRQFVLSALLPLAACSSATSPEAADVPVEARIIGVEAVPTLFGVNPSDVGANLFTARATVRSVVGDQLTISPCTAEIDARLPSSRTWTLITPPRRVACTAAVQELGARAMGEISVTGDAPMFRGVAGAEARAVVIRVRYQAISATQRYDLQSDEFTVDRP